MKTHGRRFLALSISALLLCAGGTGIALASPDGDDDPTFNADGPRGFGTQYSPLHDPSNYDITGHPAVAQDPRNGSVVNGVLITTEGTPYLQLTRYDAAGRPVTGFGEDGIVLADPGDGFNNDVDPGELLDLRVLADGTIVALIQGEPSSEGPGANLYVTRYSPSGELTDSREYDPPTDPNCQEVNRSTRGRPLPRMGVVDAARVDAAGDVSALWDCSEVFWTDRAQRQLIDTSNDVYVSQYDALAEDERINTSVEDEVNASYGEDLELGPNGDPYVLVAEQGRTRGNFDNSIVLHLTDRTLEVQEPQEGGRAEGLPVDLAVDSRGRPVVWTQTPFSIEYRGDEGNPWTVTRFTPSLDTDTGWGDGGVATITDPRLLRPPTGWGDGPFATVPGYLTVRPGDKVLVTGEDRDSAPLRSSRAESTSNAIIAGLTATGATDGGFADNGFKLVGYETTEQPDEDARTGFDAFGEPKIQGDGGVLVPHASTYISDQIIGRIAPPPSDADFAKYMGVTRLRVPATPQQPQRQPQSVPSRPVTPSSVPAICGRRAISLVRADVRGSKVKLTGLVGSAFYGKKVTIQTDPKGAKASGFAKTTTVTASKASGSFSVNVARPKAADFKSIRYRATIGKAKSPALKLPQSLTSRSVKSAKGTITVQGKVKKSVLGKRNRVTIRRLVCGRYRTVARVRPGADGSYTATFKATTIRGVSFYRAEAVVQVRPGSKKYAIQYARAIAIRTTSQTG